MGSHKGNNGDSPKVISQYPNRLFTHANFQNVFHGFTDYRAARGEKELS